MTNTSKKQGTEWPAPFNCYLSELMAASGKSNIEISKILGYPRPNVIAMLKTGAMKLPFNKIGPLAIALDVDPVHLLRRALEEYEPENWNVFQDLIGQSLVTRNELRFVELIRRLLDGQDTNLVENLELIETIRLNLSRAAPKTQHACATV